MSDTTAPIEQHGDEPTIDDIVRDLRPMGDLSRFAIEDLTPEDEEEFFAILDGV